MDNMKKYHDFAAFYPFYLSEHQDVICRRLHFLGSCIGLFCITMSMVFANALWLLAGLVAGYGFAWIGHFFFEHNKPATFQYPLYSFLGDWVMFWQILTGKVSVKD